MKRLLAITLLGSVLITGCTEQDLCLTGSGQLNEYTLAHSDFDQISISGPVSLNIQQGSEYKVSVLAEPEMYAAFEHRVQNNRLIAGYENVSCFNTDYGVTVNVTLPTVREITLEGTGIIRNTGELNLNDLEIQTSGEATVNLYGSIKDFAIDSDGSIRIRTFNLRTENTSLDIEGSADAEVSCSNTLDINVDGSARVSYKGQPQIGRRVKGNLDLIDAN